MSKKKTVLFIIIALAAGIAIGVVTTLGVMQNNNQGAVVVPTETDYESDQFGYPVMDELLNCTSECDMVKIMEVMKRDGVIKKQRLVSARWKLTFDNFTSELVPYFTKLENGKTSVEKYLFYCPRAGVNKLETSITYIPTDVASTIFTSPGEQTTDLHMFFKCGEKWVSDDGKLVVADPDAFFAGSYTKESVTYYGTEEDLAASEYSFLNGNTLLITIRSAEELKNDLGL